mmetsp:Transcript_94136/g.245180  ORF Transcript_94136/g.245180 Transcript_94136/m.245180 type:complete len:311 (+) Transcript_94136:748-1680(+)
MVLQGPRPRVRDEERHALAGPARLPRGPPRQRGGLAAREAALVLPEARHRLCPRRPPLRLPRGPARHGAAVVRPEETVVLPLQPRRLLLDGGEGHAAPPEAEADQSAPDASAVVSPRHARAPRGGAHPRRPRKLAVSLARARPADDPRQAPVARLAPPAQCRRGASGAARRPRGAGGAGLCTGGGGLARRRGAGGARAERGTPAAAVPARHVAGAGHDRRDSCQGRRGGGGGRGGGQGGPPQPLERPSGDRGRGRRARGARRLPRRGGRGHARLEAYAVPTSPKLAYEPPEQTQGCCARQGGAPAAGRAA